MKSAYFLQKKTVFSLFTLGILILGSDNSQQPAYGKIRPQATYNLAALRGLIMVL